MVTTDLVVFVLLCTISIFVESARILCVFPTPSISHQVVFRPLTLELARRGHEVVVITTDPVFPKGSTPENYTEIDVHDLSYSKWNRMLQQINPELRGTLAQIEIIMKEMTTIFTEEVKTKEVQNVLSYRNDYFDLLLTESCSRPALGFSHIFKAPVIQISSLGATLNNFEHMGIPEHPILYPNVVKQKLYNLTMWEKIIELKKEFELRRMLERTESYENEYMKTIFGADVPPIKELYKNVHMLFVNFHPIWDHNRPVPPGVIYMGGVHQKPQKELPEDLKSYLDTSKNGVIYFSLGTNVKTSNVPIEKLLIFTKVFSKLPYDVLWKWDDDELPGRSKNIKISKWLPQSDLLRHPNIKLFITQGGLQSTDEAITAAVPLIGIPMLGDQWYNVEKYVHLKIGIRLDIENLTEDIFEDAIKTIINNKSYRDNIIKLRNVMHDQPQSPLDRAVWWTEYVLRHGGASHLRSPGAGISWAEYLELELVFTVITVLVLTSAILFIAVKKILNSVQFTFKTKLA
ncbi:UDP-glycosyltransferase UGT5-like [Battus philenor]|uniref:UDP-glycosyltransferase UGT5-like n=1 Tax=Battus philenor TaxID=42288 RepID=UPI0035CF7F28